MNLGLRPNLCTLPLEVHNYQSTFNLSTLALRPAGTHGLSANAFHTCTDNLAPRFGFACKLPGDSKTSARGGFGLDFTGAMVHRSDSINSGPQ